MNVYQEVQNNRTNCLKRLIEHRDWITRIVDLWRKARGLRAAAGKA